MPTGALHSQYWQTQAAAPPETGASGTGGYVAFQAVIVASLVLLVLLQG